MVGDDEDVVVIERRTTSIYIYVSKARFENGYARFWMAFSQRVQLINSKANVCTFVASNDGERERGNAPPNAKTKTKKKKKKMKKKKKQKKNARPLYTPPNSRSPVP